MRIDTLGISVLVLILVIPLGSIALSYRAHREAALLRLDVKRFEEELAYWRETGGRLMEGLVRDADHHRPTTAGSVRSVSALEAEMDPEGATTAG